MLQFFGLERINPFQPPKIVAYEEQKSMMPNGIPGLERVKEMQCKSIGWVLLHTVMNP
jgi:hypothetical protein